MPATTNRQTPEAEAGEERKRFLFRCCMIWEKGSQPLQKTYGKPSHPKPDQNKKQCPEFLLPSFGNHRWLLSGHPGSLACSWLLAASGSFLEIACGTSAAISHTPSRATKSCKCNGQCIHQVGKRAPLPSPGFILVLGIGWTRCSQNAQLTSQLPHTPGGFTS